MSSIGGFGGSATLENSDVARLNTQLHAVRAVMSDGRFRTLEEIARLVKEITRKKATEPSVSARLRDLRKEKFGGFEVVRRLVSPGLFEYQVVQAAKGEPAKPIKFNVKGAESGRMHGGGAPNQSGIKPSTGSRATDSYLDELKKKK